MTGLSYPSHSKRRGALSFLFYGRFFNWRTGEKPRPREVGRNRKLQAGRLRAYNENAPEKEALERWSSFPQNRKP